MNPFPRAGEISSALAAVERRGFDFTPKSRRSCTFFNTRAAASAIGRMLNIPFSLLPSLLGNISEKEFRNAQKVFAKSDKPKGSGHEYYA
ncbi:MAG: hypothetical protein P1U50_00995 [Parvibaculaceae bacterium]|nr:hypothetical protein [Parvibaculaceae bacterium]